MSAIIFPEPLLVITCADGNANPGRRNPGISSPAPLCPSGQGAIPISPHTDIIKEKKNPEYRVAVGFAIPSFFSLLSILVRRFRVIVIKLRMRFHYKRLAVSAKNPAVILFLTGESEPLVSPD